MSVLIKYKNGVTSYVWERYFLELKEFCEDNNGPVRIPYNPEHKGLAKWMDRQKINKSLSVDQRQRITNLGYSLVNEKNENWITRCDRIWSDQFKSLKRYQDKYGNCNVPSSYKIDPKLANWVASQRRAFGREDLRIDRFNLLREVDFIFRLVQRPVGVSSIGKNEAKWNHKYEQIKELEKIHGSSVVSHVVKENPTLYNWIMRQRQLDRKQKGLSTIRIQKLKELGFPWKQQDQK
jgi:hypothetical protein